MIASVLEIHTLLLLCTFYHCDSILSSFFFLSSYSTLRPKFALTIPPWKRALSTWNF